MDQRVTRVGKKNGGQVVTISVEYRFPKGTKQVFIRKQGDEVILSPRPSDWSAFLASKVRASEDFMVGIDDLPLQKHRFPWAINPFGDLGTAETRTTASPRNRPDLKQR